MTPLSRNTRIAGLLYLTLLTAPLRLIHPQQAVCGGESERNRQQHRDTRDAFPPGHSQRSVYCDHGHLSHAGPLPAVHGRQGDATLTDRRLILRDWKPAECGAYEESEIVP